MPAIKLKAAETGDIEEIGRLADIVWNQHYPAIISREQIDYMLGMMYSPRAIKEQMLEKGHLFYLVEHNSAHIGFISVHREQDNDWFINKFYIDQEQAGKGFGDKAFAELLQIINPARIRLTVNRQNFKSVNFYFKLGFRIERVADFEIGSGYVMDDFVMVWKARVL